MTQSGNRVAKGLLVTLQPLVVAMLARMVENLLQIAVSGCLFVALGEFVARSR